MAQLSNLTMLEGRPVVAKYNALVQATTGTLSLSVAGSSDVTLTNAQAAYYLIVLTGVLTGNIVVKVPQREKPYVIFNNTTGSFTLAVRPVTSGVGVDVTQGGYAQLFCDGVDVIALSPQVTSGGMGFIQYVYADAQAGPSLTGRKARGTAASPTVSLASDATRSMTGESWSRNAGDTANGWQQAGRVRIRVDSVDAQNRIGGMIDFDTSPGVSAAIATRMRLRESGDLVLGNPVTGSDIVTLRQADILGVAGESGLQIIDETGVTTSIGKGLLSRKIVEANTAGSGAPNVLTVDEAGKVLTNEGATAQNYHTLPGAVAGLAYTFINQDTDNMRITAAAGDTIRFGSTVSSSGGFVTSTAKGDSMTLVAVNTTEWYATSVVGTWSAS